jgi:hypothetical protein
MSSRGGRLCMHFLEAGMQLLHGTVKKFDVHFGALEGVLL